MGYAYIDAMIQLGVVHISRRSNRSHTSLHFIMQDAMQVTYRTDEVYGEERQYEIPVGLHVVRTVSVVLVGHCGVV